MARIRLNMTIRVPNIRVVSALSDTQTADVVDAQADIVLADASIDAAVVDLATADQDCDDAIADIVLADQSVDDAKADLVSASAALVTMDSDLDTLIASANSANSSNDATTEINAIRDAGTGYVVNIAIVEALNATGTQDCTDAIADLVNADASIDAAVVDIGTADQDCDDAIADLVNAAASLTQGTLHSADADVSVSYNTTNVTKLSQLRQAFDVALSLAASQGLSE